MKVLRAEIDVLLLWLYGAVTMLLDFSVNTGACLPLRASSGSAISFLTQWKCCF